MRNCVGYRFLHSSHASHKRVVVTSSKWLDSQKMVVRKFNSSTLVRNVALVDVASVCRRVYCSGDHRFEHPRVELPLSGLHGEKLYLTGYSALRQKVMELNAMYEELPAHRGVRDTILLDAFGLMRLCLEMHFLRRRNGFWNVWTKLVRCRDHNKKGRRNSPTIQGCHKNSTEEAGSKGISVGGYF